MALAPWSLKSDRRLKPGLDPLSPAFVMERPPKGSLGKTNGRLSGQMSDLCPSKFRPSSRESGFGEPDPGRGILQGLPPSTQHLEVHV